MPSFPRTNRISVTGWLGLLWVWSSVGWLIAGLVAWGQEPHLVTAFVALRLLLHLATGVGICAGERWGWAWAVCSCVLAGVTAGGLGLGAGGTWLLLPEGSLSWKPVFLGLVPSQTGAAALIATVLAMVCGLVLRILLRERQQFEIPNTRTYALLVQWGIMPSLITWIVDGYLLLWWWPASQR